MQELITFLEPNQRIAESTVLRQKRELDIMNRILPRIRLSFLSD
jgi:hypothetical protein